MHRDFRRTETSPPSSAGARSIVLLAVLLAGACGPAPPPAEEPGASLTPALGDVVGEVERLRAGLDGVVAPGSGLEIVATGLSRPGGLAWIRSGAFLLLADAAENKVYRWRPNDGASVWHEPLGAGGLLAGTDGGLVLCQPGDRRVARVTATWEGPQLPLETLASTFRDQKLNGPYAAVFDRTGNLYFTDPAPAHGAGSESTGRDLDFQGVFRRTPGGQLELVTHSLTQPTGVALSPDERVLYVANADPDDAIWMAYDVFADGTMSPGRVFFDATEWVAEGTGLPGGLAVDREGNLFATGPGGVVVVSPFGMHLGTLRTPRPAAYVTFGGGDGSWLFVTAGPHLLRIRLETRG